MAKNQLIVDAANVYIYKEDGKVLPVNHPDLSTQPSVLPERFGKLRINEVLLEVSSKNELTDHGVTNYNGLYARIKEGEFVYPDSTIIEARFFGVDKLIYPSKVVKEGDVWKFYIDMSLFMDMKYVLVKYFYKNTFK